MKLNRLIFKQPFIIQQKLYRAIYTTITECDTITPPA